MHTLASRGRKFGVKNRAGLLSLWIGGSLSSSRLLTDRSHDLTPRPPRLEGLGHARAWLESAAH